MARKRKLRIHDKVQNRLRKGKVIKLRNKKTGRVIKLRRTDTLKGPAFKKRLVMSSRISPRRVAKKTRTRAKTRV